MLFCFQKKLKRDRNEWGWIVDHKNSWKRQYPMTKQLQYNNKLQSVSQGMLNDNMLYTQSV